MVNLKVAPYNLSNEQIKWVNETIEKMTVEEKIGQLFFHFFDDIDNDIATEVISKYKIGGMRYQSVQPKKLQDFINHAQSVSEIPLFVAGNCDAGADGAIKGGTYVASGAQVEATGSEEVAYNVGLVSGREVRAIGVNWNFGPNADILYNWRNTIVNTRAYGNNPDAIVKYNKAFIEGLDESNVMACLKHFPGDGVEENDQHLQLGVNDFSVEKWTETFGKVYQTAIDNGLPTIMAGQIALPEYQKHLNPDLKDEDILPATLAPELITDLLKGKMGFNGLVVTDASHMIGLAAAMKRRDYVPKAIAAGCDMFLFFNDLEEDFEYMLNGYRSGVITDERLHDALSRILGLKAMLSLPEAQEDGTLLRQPEDLEIIGSKEHLSYQEEAAEKGITLVKNTKDELPITPETHKRIILYTYYGEEGGAFDFNRDSQEIIIEELEKAGFDVTLHTDIQRPKGKIEEYVKNYDVALVFADVQGYATENVVRIRWKASTSNEIPWYVHEVPTVFVSLNYTNHLHDVPMVKTFINSYKNTRTHIRLTIEKMMGKSNFNGQYNENVFCGQWKTRL